MPWSPSARSRKCPRGMRASDDDLDIVLNQLKKGHAPATLSNYLSVFGNRKMPVYDSILLTLCEHEDIEVRRRAYRALAKITHTDVRVFAVERLLSGHCTGDIVGLLVENFQPGDEAKSASNLVVPGDDESAHALFMAVLAVLEKNPEADATTLGVAAYRNSPCGECRRAVVALMQARPLLPRWMQEECENDAVPEIRQLVRPA